MVLSVHIENIVDNALPIYIYMIIFCAYSYRQLQKGYPLFADEQSFLMLMMTSTNYYDESCPLYVLYQFILNRPELDYGVRILPGMVDFYQWIHKQFPYCLTRKETETMTMSQLLEDELKNATTDDQYRHRRAQFAKICG